MQRSLTVTRLSGDQYQFRWPAGLFKMPVSIHWGASPDTKTSEYRPLALVEQGNEVVVADPSPGRRPYFLLTPAEGQPRVTAERRLPLSGQVNFRDLGGYATTDGRRVRWGHLYRSGDLSKLTGGDLAYLASLDLKLVCDLRVDFEVERAPDLLPQGAARQSLPIRGGEMPDAELYDTVDNGDFARLDADFLLHGNRMFVREFTPVYAEMLQQVMAGEYRPAVVHCTAGKDRAGLGAAIILLVLGVPLETVFDDYLLSNIYRAEWTKRTLGMIRQAAAERSGAAPESIDLAPVEALFEARRVYLATALETIDQQYGSLECYMREGLGLSPQAQKAFQASLLE
jgi:protein-tyrosine phosphatase